MLERFTREARDIVTAAEREARSLSSSRVRPQHLLVALAERCLPLFLGSGPLLRFDDPYPITAAKVRAALASDDPDAEALSLIGISLADVRRAVEEAFGSEAWAPTSGDPLPFAPETKRALEDALREAVELKTRRIGATELLLGLLRRSEEARALVVRCGVDPETLYERHRSSIKRLGRLAAR